MPRSEEISSENFIAITIDDELGEYPVELRTAWLDVAADRLYIPAALADLRQVYLEAKKLESQAGGGLPIIEHGEARFVDVTWLREICPTQAEKFRLLEEVFRQGLFSLDHGADLQ